VKKKKPSVTTPREKKRASTVPSSFSFPLVRTYLLAAIGVLASAYGVWRYYTVPRPSMLAPRAPAPAPSEIPIEVE
jgi:hypothetical protein